MSDNILIYKRDRTIYLSKSVVPILSKVVEEYICFVILAIDSFICELTCISHTRPSSILIFVPLLVKSCIQLFYSTFFTRLSLIKIVCAIISRPPFVTLLCTFEREVVGAVDTIC